MFNESCNNNIDSHYKKKLFKRDLPKFKQLCHRLKSHKTSSKLSFPRKSTLKGDEDCKMLSLKYSMTECYIEVLLNIMALVLFVTVTCVSAIVKKNNYRLPINL